MRRLAIDLPGSLNLNMMTFILTSPDRGSHQYPHGRDQV
jgi:hypothetical protein